MQGNTAEVARARAQLGAVASIDAYRHDTPVFFASQRETWLAQRSDVAARVARPWDDQLSRCLERDLHELARTEKGARLALALPFARGDVAHGFLLANTQSSLTRPETRAMRRSALAGHAELTVSFMPAPARYEQAVEELLRALNSGRVSKVVLGRKLAISFGHSLDVGEILRRFYAQNASAFVFAIELGEAERRRTLLGASPELLVCKKGDQVCTNPLAGSRPRSADVATDQARSATLLGSEKDRREHQLVVTAVADALAPFCRELDVPAAPSLSSTPTMWHLSSKIRGVLRDPALSSLTLVEALHPTPAVAGEPREAALALIRELEPQGRGLFAGAVGHVDASGDGEWAVTLRGCEVESDRVTLFAGAGIVVGSDPADELDETSAKLRTALRALGVPLVSETP